jgi:hypothetical protein
MPKLLNKDAILKQMGESHDQLSKVALLLLGAHGASLATCATVLKDAASKPQVSGIAVFTLFFGVGLLASVVNYASVFMVRAVVKSSLMNDEDPNDSPSAGFLKILNVATLAIAVLALVAAILLVIWRSISG